MLADLIAKAARLPGNASELRYVLCARQAVRNTPDGTLSCTATEIFDG